jgi:hypothetical protein
MVELNPNPTWAGLLSVILPPFLGPFIWQGIRAYRHKVCTEWSLTLNCWKKNHLGDLEPVQLFLCRDTQGDEFWRRCRCGNLGLTRQIPSSKRGGNYSIKDITVIQPTGVWWPAGAESFNHNQL